MGGVKSLIAMHYLSWSIYYKKEKSKVHRQTNIIGKGLRLTEETRDD